ncbi:MAG: RNA-directed DNA polymerase [Candidatus Moraniibacteriota bacterium]
MRTIFTYHNLYLAYLECRTHKRKTINALAFEFDFEVKLAALLSELRARTYQPGRSLYFVVTEPKPREIFAADFCDRVVHHLFVRELLPFAERQFTRDSFACRTGKGTHRAVAQLRHFIRNNGEKSKPYYLQLDIRTFFPRIDKVILSDIVERLIRSIAKSDVWMSEMLALARLIIWHDPTLSYVYRGNPQLKALVPIEKSLVFQPKGKGLPIGNYTSQFFAHLYLHELDAFVKRTLRCRQYVRYADDLILLDPDPVCLRQWQDEIGQFLAARLSLHLQPKKTRLQPVRNGIDFLGYFLRTEYTLVRRNVVNRLKNKLCVFQSVPVNEAARVLACLNSYCGHFRYARSFRLRRAIAERHVGVWRRSIEPTETFAHFKRNGTEKHQDKNSGSIPAEWLG